MLGGITGLVMQDTVYSTIRNIYEDRIGYLPKVIYDLSKPSFDTSMEFGIKIVGLIVGWFLLLFILEVIARVVLLIVGAIVRTIFYKKEEKENGSEAVC